MFEEYPRRGIADPNYVAKGDRFYVSYNPSPIIGGDGPETALYGEMKDGEWHILNGDWRIQYELLVPEGFDACLAFYNTKKEEHRCGWSTD